MITFRLSFFRIWGLVLKEFTQLKRDRFTFLLIIGLPIVQLLLFGLAINSNPKYLPTAVIDSDHGPFSRTLIHGLENTQYFKFNHFPQTEDEAMHLMRTHQAQFVLSIPSDFSRKFVRGEYPTALLEVDGTDPAAVAYALSASANMMRTVFQYDVAGLNRSAALNKNDANLQVHIKYNPSGVTQYNIVPGLLGLVLTMTFIMVTSMALTRERETGTLECLLSTSLLPIEVIIGKSVPFVVIGYLQVLVILLMAIFFFYIPFVGSFLLLLLVTFPFILANLFVGISFSTFAKTQLEASQLSSFFMMPSMMLSGFAFPFNGMPGWAQWIGNLLPLTHFNNISRGIMLKGIGFEDLWIDLWPILIFMSLALILAVVHYRQTLD